MLGIRANKEEYIPWSECKEYVATKASADVVEQLNKLAALSDRHNVLMVVSINPSTNKPQGFKVFSTEGKHIVESVAYAVELNYILRDKENINEIELKNSPLFKGSVWQYFYADDSETQDAVIILDPQGCVMSTFDQGLGRIEPPVITIAGSDEAHIKTVAETTFKTLVTELAEKQAKLKQDIIEPSR